jgi:hypothetical protein
MAKLSMKWKSMLSSTGTGLNVTGWPVAPMYSTITFASAQSYKNNVYIKSLWISAYIDFLSGGGEILLMIISCFLVENQLYKKKYWMKTPWG